MLAELFEAQAAPKGVTITHGITNRLLWMQLNTASGIQLHPAEYR